MPKSLKDLNWSLFLINILGAAAMGILISIAGHMSLTATGLTIVSMAAKDAVAFFSDAKKKLSEE